MDWGAIKNMLERSSTKYSFYFGDYNYRDYSNGKMAKKKVMMKFVRFYLLSLVKGYHS